MGSKTDHGENAVLGYIFEGTSMALGADLFLALSSAVYSDSATGSSMSEFTGTGYARVAIPRDGTDWTITGSSPTQVTNANDVAFPQAGSDWGTPQSFYICDAATGGNTLYGGSLTNASDIASGDTAKFAAGALVATED